MKHPPGEIISLWELIAFFSSRNKKNQGGSGRLFRGPRKNILELLKVLLCFMTLLWRMWCISWDKRWLPTQKVEFWEKRLPKEISPGCSLEGLMLKLKLQYFGHLLWRGDSFWKRSWCWEGLGAGGEGDDRGWDGWMASPTQWAWVWVNSGSWWWIGRPGVLWFMGSQRVGHDWVTELNWWRWMVW